MMVRQCMGPRPRVFRKKAGMAQAGWVVAVCLMRAHASHSTYAGDHENHLICIIRYSFGLCRESPNPRIGWEGRVGTDGAAGKAFFQLH
jgi:hypothetical protein